MDKYQISRESLVTVTLVIEGILLLVSAIWVLTSGFDLRSSFHLNLRFTMYGIGAGLVTVLVGFALLAISTKMQSVKPIADVRAVVLNDLAPMFAQLTLTDIVLISISSSFCEEVFYRGMLQNILDIPRASLIFGAMHCPSLAMIPYAFITFLAGAFLGWLYQFTGSLFPPIFAHFLNNLLVMLFFKYRKTAK
ncbi:MAG TPA: CPBP family intramembrane glutamic endopeptidase [Drouetiella sp.]